MMDVVDKILCDWCGENFYVYEKESDTSYPCGGRIQADFGFGSRFDACMKEDEYVGDICDKCFEKNILSHLRQRKEVKK